MKKHKHDKKTKTNQALPENPSPYEKFWRLFERDPGLRSTRLVNGGLLVTVCDAAAQARIPARIDDMPIEVVVAPIGQTAYVA